MKTPILLCILFIVIISCSENDEPGKKEPQLTFAESIAGVWVVSEVTKDGDLRGEWPEFELDITKSSDTSGYFASTGTPQGDKMEFFEHLWNGAWYRPNTGSNYLQRDSSEIKYLLVDSLNLMSLEVWYEPYPCISTDSTACTLIITGEWLFEMIRKEQ